MKQLPFALFALCLLCCKPKEKESLKTSQDTTTSTIISIDCSNQCDDETVTSETETTSIPEPKKVKIINQKSKVKRQNIFNFSNEEAVQLLCLQNTKVTFLPNSFVYADSGKPVAGNVKVVVKEFYKPSDIIQSKLTTQTKDGLLETRGMVHITATAHGKPCKLKPGKNIKLDFPTKKFETGFSYFKGEPNEDASIIWTESKIAANLNDFKRSSPRIINIKRERVKVSFVSKVSAQNRFEPNAFDNYFDKQFVSLFKDKSLKGYTEEKNGQYYVFTKLIPFDFNTGEFKGIKTSNININTGYLPQVKKILNNASQSLCYDNLKRNSKYRGYMKIIVLADTSGAFNLEHFKANYDFSNDIYYEDTITIYADNLSWINVDRFLKYKPDELDDFIVETGPNNGIDLKPVFNEERTYLAGQRKGDKVIFKNIPKNKAVTLFAVKKQGKKHYFSMATTNTNDKNYQLKFEPYTKAKYQKRLKDFNHI